MNEQTNEAAVEATIAPAAVRAPKAGKPKAVKVKAKPAKKAASTASTAKKAASTAKKAASTAKKAASTAKGTKGPAVLRQYAPQYHRDTEKKTAGGHVSVDCDDDTANKLRGKDLDAVYALAAKTLKEDEKALRARYKNLNLGMQRMNLGNRIRAALAG